MNDEFIHVAVTAVPDFFSRRESYRDAHLERLRQLHDAGVYIAGGPSPDGQAADLFFRLSAGRDARSLVEEDPYWTSAAWVDYRARKFERFIEPSRQVAVVLDGSRRVTIVEVPVLETEGSHAALRRLCGAAHLAFAGILEGSTALAVTPGNDDCLVDTLFADSALWARSSLTARPLLRVF